MILTFVHALPRLLAQKKFLFFASSFFSRVAWAGMIVYLATALAADEYGEFSFWTITAGSLSAVIFGGFANSFAYEQSRVQLQSGPPTSPIVYATYVGLCFFVFFGVAAAFLYSVSLEIDLRRGALVGGLATSLTLSSLAVSHMCALRLFNIASVCAALGPVIFILLSFLYSDGTSERILIFSIIGNVVSFTPALFAARGQWQQSGGHFAQARGMMRLHVRSLGVSLANLPVQGSLLVLAAALMADQGAATFAQYGLANQLIGVLLFIPTALAPIFLAQLPQWETSTSRYRVLWIWSGLLFLIMIASTIPIVSAITITPDWIDPIFLTAASTGLIATTVAALVASRSPFAWLNQAKNNTGAEWAAALVTCCTILALVLFIDMDSAESAMNIRVIAAFLSLFASFAAFYFYLRRSERGPD